MGDRTYTSIEFSGDISEQQAEELIGLLDDQCGDDASGIPLVQGHAERKFTLEHLCVPHNSFSDDECNYATMDEIESWCTLNRVSYLKTWAAGGDYVAGLELYDYALKTAEQVAALDSSPAISLSDLIKIRDEGEIDKAIERLNKFENFSKKYPPLKIYALNDWPDDLCKFLAERALLGE